MKQLTTPTQAFNCSDTTNQIQCKLYRMHSECYLSAKFRLGVHAAGSSEGIIEQDESIALHIKSQVRTRGVEKMKVFLHLLQFLSKI